MAKKPKKVPFKTPTLEEVKAYFKEKGYKEDVAVKFYEGYSCNEWRDRNNQLILNWRMKAWHVWFIDANKETAAPANKQFIKPAEELKERQYKPLSAATLLGLQELKKNLEKR